MKLHIVVIAKFIIKYFNLKIALGAAVLQFEKTVANVFISNYRLTDIFFRITQNSVQYTCEIGYIYIALIYLF